MVLNATFINAEGHSTFWAVCGLPLVADNTTTRILSFRVVLGTKSYCFGKCFSTACDNMGPLLLTVRKAGSLRLRISRLWCRSNNWDTNVFLNIRCLRFCPASLSWCKMNAFKTLTFKRRLKNFLYQMLVRFLSIGYVLSIRSLRSTPPMQTL